MTGEVIEFRHTPTRPTKPREEIARDLLMALRPGATAPEVVRALRGKWTNLTATEIASGFCCLHKIVETVHLLVRVDLGLDHGADDDGGDRGGAA